MRDDHIFGFFGVDGEMMRGNPQRNKIGVGLNSGHQRW